MEYSYLPLVHFSLLFDKLSLLLIKFLIKTRTGTNSAIFVKIETAFYGKECNQKQHLNGNIKNERPRIRFY